MLFLRSFVLELKERNTEQKHQKQVLIHQCFVKVFLVPWIPWLKFLHERRGWHHRQDHHCLVAVRTLCLQPVWALRSDPVGDQSHEDGP